MDQAPPYSVVFKFFVAGLIFAILAGGVLLFGDINLEVRGLEISAILHLLTLGFFAMIMIGALFQMLPVVAGVVYDRATLLSNIIIISMILGILTLVIALFLGKFGLFLYTKLFFILSLYLFCIISVYKLIRIKPKTPTIIAIILSLLYFILAISFGFLVLYMFEGNAELIPNLKNIHSSSAFFGWIFLLILGISYQVIPMFWVTTTYPKIFQNYTAYLLSILLLSFSFGVINNTIFTLGIASILIAYGVITLIKFTQRKRKVPDISMNFWKVGIYSLFLATVLQLFSLFSDYDVELLIGFTLGFFVMSVIIGMLYKIVPFLTWFHLSSRGIFDIPTMKEMIPKNLDKIHFIVHISLFFLGVITITIDNIIFFKLFALSFIIAKTLMLYNVLMISKFYYSRSV